MSAPRFTPGSWCVDISSSNRRVFMPDDTVEVRANGGLIAALYRVNHHIDGLTDAANARLIAAAPDLYLALVETVCELHAALRGEGDMNDTPAVIGKAEAALAKARGDA